MKKLYLLPLFVFMALAMFSCSDDDTKEIFPPLFDTTSASYNGTLLVNGVFTKENTKCEITLNDEKDKLTLGLFKVKFAEAMPVELDIKATDMPCTTNNEGVLVFEADSVTPMVGLVPMPKYKLYNVQGTIDDNTLSFTASLSMGSFTYSGTVVEEE